MLHAYGIRVLTEHCERKILAFERKRYRKSCEQDVLEGIERRTLHQKVDKKKSSPRSDTVKTATICALYAE